LILQRIETSENLSQHFKIVTWRWRHIWRHQKCPFTDKDGHLTKAFQKEKYDIASQLLKEDVNKIGCVW